MLLLPQKGNPDAKKHKYCAPLFKALTKDEVFQYKALFTENNESQRDLFFGSEYIRALWPVITSEEYLTRQNWFAQKKNNKGEEKFQEKHLDKYRAMVDYLKNFYLLTLPQWIHDLLE